RLSFDEDRLDPNQYLNDPLTRASLSSVATSKTILRDTRLQLCNSRALREGECGDRSWADHFEEILGDYLPRIDAELLTGLGMSILGTLIGVSELLFGISRLFF
ncbi:hypothetical protein M885DRAFT_568496, partial [Pelagophyceae sp. CCMP2097]